ncbi:MAG: phytanoyl-CoA dioxygenase family protein [Rhodoglobus sp.]
MTPPSPAEVSTVISDEAWDGFSRDGFLHLGQVLSADAIEQLKQRADDLAAGVVKNPRVLLQLDTGGEYLQLPDAVAAFDAPTKLYRKIQGLEFDDEFLPLIRHPRFFEVCARIYGPHIALSLFRAMIMNKPAGQGTILPWHQDGGDVWGLDREPLVTIWVALDDATPENGCMQAVRGSHRNGLLSSYGSTLSDDDATLHCPPDKVVDLAVPAGHAVLMHNWLIHRSGLNPSPNPRRAVTICYLDGRTRSTQTGELMPIIAGTVDPTPHHYVSVLREQVVALGEAVTRAEEYAKSLEPLYPEAKAYAEQLEAEIAKIRANAEVGTAPPAGVGVLRRAARRIRRALQ